MAKIKEIKIEVDKMSEKDRQQRLSSNLMPSMNVSHAVMNDQNQLNSFNNPKPVMMDEELFLCELKRNINELQTQDIRVSMQDLKIFEIKCNKIPISALPAGTKEPRLLTEFVKINPNNSNLK
jgi:hypothetical protein